MKHTFLFAALLFGATIAGPAVRAQVPNESTYPEELRASQDQAIRQSLVQKIEELKYNKIKKELGLDDATAAKFFEIYKPAEKDIQALVKERNFELKALGAATDASTSDADITAMTEKIKDLNQQIAGSVEKLDANLAPILTPLQRAKLLVFEHEFNQRVREQLEKHPRLRAELRALRQRLRRQRIKNELLKKQAEKEGQR
jgi:Spy/CpxP family protein refolding chaperone